MMRVELLPKLPCLSFVVQRSMRLSSANREGAARCYSGSTSGRVVAATDMPQLTKRLEPLIDLAWGAQRKRLDLMRRGKRREE